MCCTLISRSLRQGHSHHRRKESEEEEDDDKAWKCLSRMERGPCLRSYKGPIGWGSAGVTCAQREPPRDRRCHWKGDAWCPEHRRGSHSLEQFPEWKAWNLSVASPDTTGCLSSPQSVPPNNRRQATKLTRGGVQADTSICRGQTVTAFKSLTLTTSSVLLHATEILMQSS